MNSISVSFFKILLIQFFMFSFALAMNDTPTVIFHFEGCIADTMKMEYEIITNFFNIDPKMALSLLDYNRTKSITSRIVLIRKAFKNHSVFKLIKLNNISQAQVSGCLEKVRTEMAKDIESIKPITNIVNILTLLKQRGINLGILTSNSRENVMNFLKINKLDNFFDENMIWIGGLDTVFKKHALLDQNIDKLNLNPNNVIYVGNEIRDVDATIQSKRVNVGIFIGDKTSYNNYKSIKKHIESERNNSKVNKDLQLLNLNNNLAEHIIKILKI